MSPTAKELLSGLSSLFTRQTAPDEDIDELQKSANTHRQAGRRGQAAEDLRKQAALLSRQESIDNATQRYLEAIIEAGVDPDHDFPVDLLPLKAEVRTGKFGLKRTETIARPTRQDVMATTVLQLIKKEDEGRGFEYNSRLEVGIATLPGGIRQDEQTDKKLDKRVYDSTSAFKKQIQKAVEEGKKNPDLDRSEEAVRTIKDYKKGEMGKVVGVMLGAHEKIWLSRGGGEKEDPFDYVVNPGTRELLRYIATHYSGMKREEFENEVLGRFSGRRRKSEPKKTKESPGFRARIGGKTMAERKNTPTAREILLDKQGTAAVEVILCGRVEKPDFISGVKKMIGSDNIFEKAKRNGWRVNDTPKGDLQLSCECASKQRGGEIVDADKHRDTVRRIIIYMTWNKQSRGPWAKELKGRDDLSAIRFIYAITKDIVGDRKAADDLFDLIYPKGKEYKTNFRDPVKFGDL